MEIADNLRNGFLIYGHYNWKNAGRDKKSETGPNVPPDLECVTLLPLKTEAGNNEISRQKTIKNHKSSVLVSAIYNGWAEITRTMIDDRKKYNVNKGKCCGF